ncbi:MAG: 2-C-methyl-D-erythritol 4-phosphate cytidylyltransferase [Prosthecobacter sp.]|nr:2-C-methyl-D-erythritol 4-phosphate cytidylyltransferase [Prosthecobacter sp.]
MTSAIIVAAGSSSRMGFNKLLAPLAGVPVLLRTLQAFEACAEIAEVVVVAGDAVREALTAWLTDGELAKLATVIPGGAARHLSVWAGIQACSAAADLIAVHDGARPLITPAQISKCIRAARDHGAAACARPMSETLKRADAQGRVTDSIDRSGVWVMETPQVFQRDLLVRAYEQVLQTDALVTDEVSALQQVGASVFVVENTEPNPKITFPADLICAAKHLA